MVSRLTSISFRNNVVWSPDIVSCLEPHTEQRVALAYKDAILD